MLKRKLVSAAAGLLLSLVPVSSLHAQAQKWVMPSNIIDFSTSPPKASPLPGPTPIDPFRVASVANGAFDSAGNLLFYVSQGQQSSKLDLFGSNGIKIDQLARAADSLQIAVVPVPLSCDLKYYIVYFTRIGLGKARLVLVYSIVDAAGTVLEKDVQVPPDRLGLTFNLAYGSLAVTTLRSGATRFLYAVNNNFLDKFLIGPSGISLDSTLLESDAGFLPVQAVLSSDGGKLAFGTPDGILIATLDSLGNFSDRQDVAVTSLSGLAFSRDGGMLFFGDGGGLNYIRLADPLTVIPLPGSGGYGNSQLQLAANDRIYAAGFSDDFDLGAIDPTGPIPSFMPGAVLNVVAGNFPGVFTLPAQIAGEPLCGNPALVQSNVGVQRDFEVVIPFACGGLAHYSRLNDVAGFPWQGPDFFGADVGAVDAVAMIQSDYGNLEVVARIGDRLAHFWRGGLQWHGPVFFASGASGTPSFVQGNRHGSQGDPGSPGDFELVTPLAAGGLAHYSRTNAFYLVQTWSEPALFASTLGNVTDVSLIQSTLGSAGNNLEVVARVGDRLVHLWRDEIDKKWYESTSAIATGVSGTPSLIQGNYVNSNGKGNFELVAPLAAGGMAHYWRSEDGTWHGPSPFADGNVRSVSLIQSNYGQNFEVVARRNCGLVHYWRSDASASSPWTWFGGGTIIP